MKRPIVSAVLMAFVACIVGSQTQAANISLASTMESGGPITTQPDLFTAGGIIAEGAVTGSYAQIAQSPNGLYSTGAPGPPLNTPFAGLTIFPNGNNFGVGSVTYDDSGITGVGRETAPITALDTSLFWAPGSAVTDIRDNDASGTGTDGLDAWFFGPNSSFTFGPATGTVTLIDGAERRIDLTSDFTFSTDFGFFGPGVPIPWNGTFSIVGNEIAFLINDSGVVVDLQGTVDAVPEPGTAGFACLMLVAAGLKRRRRS